MADLDLAALGQRLGGHSYAWAQRHWRTLRHPATGAPLPLPYVGAGRGQHPRWLAEAVDAWKAGQFAPAAPHAGACPTQREPQPRADNDPTPAPTTDLVAALLAAAGS